MQHWYIVRHGETDYNRKQLIQGMTDIPLNEAGREQARQARMALDEKGITFDHFFSSPLCRAVETAKMLFGKEEEPVIVPELTEMNFGIWEGHSYVNGPLEILVLNKKPAEYVAPEGGESFPEMFVRLGGFFEKLKQSDLEGNILIASHGMAIRGILALLRNTPVERIWDQRIGNCDMFHFTWDGETLTEHPMVLDHDDPYDPHFKGKEE